MVTISEKELFSGRLKQALLAAGFPDRGMTARLKEAVSFKISDKGVRKWLVGEAIPSTDRLPEIAEIAGVTTEWLLSGRGPMTPDGGNELLDLVRRDVDRVKELTKEQNAVHELSIGYVVDEPDIFLHPDTRAQLREHPELQELVASLVELAKAGRGDVISLIGATIRQALENLKEKQGITEPQGRRIKIRRERNT